MTLRVGPSLGKTAANGGAGYVGAFRACHAAACWVTGLPSTVTLGPHRSRPVTFTVRVPRWTADGQYLAGISVASAETPAPVRVGAAKRAGAQAIILETVTGHLDRKRGLPRGRPGAGGRIGPLAYAILPAPNGVPRWAWILGTFLLVVLLAVAAYLVLLHRRAHLAYFSRT